MMDRKSFYTRREEFLNELNDFILPPYETADKYEEEIVGEFENEVEESFFKEFMDYLPENASVLDLACGDGRHTLRLSQNAEKVVAVDISPKQLKMAKEKCKNRSNITFINASMFNLSLPRDYFDGIWFSQGFEYVPPDKREQLIETLHMMLKNNGVLYMSVETWMYPEFINSLKELLRDVKLFFCWRFIRNKPLLWGEFLYYLSPETAEVRCRGWHYHVHTDKWTIHKLLQKVGFKILRSKLCEGYIYIICRMRSNE